MDNFSNKYELIRLKAETFSIQNASYCCVCKKKFVATDGFVRYPNGVLTHVNCATNRQICPLTGHLFKIDVQYNS